MPEIPEDVKAYLVSHNVLAREQLHQQYPNLEQLMGDPQTRKTILDWLASEEAWADSSAVLAMRCLEFLQNGATEDEAPIVKTFLLHSNTFVRLRAFEFLLTLYFPDKNREAMFILLHSMLFDPDDTVRVSGVSYIERANAIGELKEFLQRWIKVAASRGWENTQSYELIEQLLAPLTK
jgi:hypothetical protein